MANCESNYEEILLKEQGNLGITSSALWDDGSYPLIYGICNDAGVEDFLYE